MNRLKEGKKGKKDEKKRVVNKKKEKRRGKKGTDELESRDAEKGPTEVDMGG